MRERIFEFPYYVRVPGSPKPFERVVVKAKARNKTEAKRVADQYVRERYEVVTVH